MLHDGKNAKELDFLSLVSHDGNTFKEGVKFYTKLGFRVYKNYFRLANTLLFSEYENASLQQGITNDSFQEMWLESFPLQNQDEQGNSVPWQELSVYQGDDSKKLSDGLLLKLRLVESEGLKHIKMALDFFTTDLPKVKRILCDDMKLRIDETADKYVQVQDPFGNTLTFGNTENILSRKTFNSPENYLAYKSEKLIEEIRATETRRPSIALACRSKKKKIAVMTSGGDAPGMNPAVRAVVRSGIFFGCDMFAVYEGYQGLVEGGSKISQMGWNDVRSFLTEGGTAIGTARCKEFREREGRLSAAANMVTAGIDALIVCGGDGSLTGADLFRSEWPSLIQELVDTNRFSASEVEPYRHLNIVGLLGSIDNDMATTDATIGAYSSLERICEMVDCIDSTAVSHSRAFVVEVMGRNCGWLGLMAGLATGADYIFIPERPPKAGEWENHLKSVCYRHRAKGKRNIIVIVSEGAIDDDLKSITSEEVKNQLTELGLDTRITTLGHLQRGGNAVAFDRMLGSVQGFEAVKAAIELTPDDPSPMIGVVENNICRQHLMESVKVTKLLSKAIQEKNFDKAIGLRDSSFSEAYNQFASTTFDDIDAKLLPEEERLNIGIIHVGASCAAMNATTRAAALYFLSKGHKVYGIMGSFSGFCDDDVKELNWLGVESWHNKGGSELGTNRSLPNQNFGKVAYYMQKYNMKALIIVGGFEAFTSLHQLETHKSSYPIFDIPKVVIPAVVSNNVPGTEYSLGSDTCLNQLVSYCDAIKQSASSSRRRVFVVEVQGGYSGYIASCCGLVTGAVVTYTPEEKLNLNEIQQDVGLLFDVFKKDKGEDRNGKLIIRNEVASSVYTTQLIADLFAEAGKGVFVTRSAIPGHVQQGFVPSCMDRIYAVKFAVRTCQFIESWYQNRKPRDSHLSSDVSSSVVMCLLASQLKSIPVTDLFVNQTSVELRKGTHIHWEKLREIGEVLSGRHMYRNR